MAWFRSKFRHLYLLALFQLVGGPLVLVPLIMMTRVVVRETATHGLVEGLTRAQESEEWREADGMLQHLRHLTVPNKDARGKTSGAPEKSKDVKPKLDLALWAESPACPLEGLPVAAPHSRWLPMASDWAHAPPIPPPRAV